MKGRIHFRHAIWLLFIPWLLCPVQIKAGINEKTFPIPQATVEQVITVWLQTTGFRIYRTHVNLQKTEFRAEKDDEHWHIIIRPQSALASHVKAQWTGPKDQGIHDPYQPLWYQISKQVGATLPRRHTSTKSIPSRLRFYKKAVVCVRIITSDTEKQVTGFFLKAREGLILSTAHDLAAFQNIIVVLRSGREISGQVVLLDQQLDLALIRVASKQEAGILLNESRNLLNFGDQLYTLGCSANGRGKLTSGFVDGPPRRADNQLLWQVKMVVLPGNSGSPVFDDQGRLVAVVKGRHRVEEQVGFLIPMETVIAFIKANIDYVQ